MIYSLEKLKTPIDITGLVSKNYQQFELEIGVGKGRYLADLAEMHKDRLFIGIEKSLKWFKKADKKIELKQLNNVLLFHGYLESFIEREAFQNLGFEKIHIMFPDPWPKSRHHKRRLFSLANIEFFYRVLNNQGKIILGTDHNDYFKNIVDCFQNEVSHLFKLNLSCTTESQSNFEIKYQEEGRRLYFFEAQKNSSGSEHPNLRFLNCQQLR